MLRHLPALALGGALLVIASHVSIAQSPPAQVVKERQDAMESLWPKYYRDISTALKNDSPDLGVVATRSALAVEELRKISQLFPPGSGRDVVPDSRAKPEIWTQRAEFEATLKALIDATAALGDAAKSGNTEKVKAEWQEAAKACAGCHGGPKKAGGKFRFEEG